MHNFVIVHCQIATTLFNINGACKDIKHAQGGAPIQISNTERQPHFIYLFIYLSIYRISIYIYHGIMTFSLTTLTE